MSWCGDRLARLARSARRRWVLLAGLATVTVVLLVLVVGVGLAGNGQKGAEPARVHREDLIMTVEVTGELAAVRAVEIGPPPVKDLWEFKISFMLPESSVVKKGQTILGLDAQQLEKSLEEKQAEFEEASKQIERKQIDLDMQIKTEEIELAEAQARLRKARMKTDIPEDLRGRLEAVEAHLELSDAEKEIASLTAKIGGTRSVGDSDLRALRSRRDRAKGRVEDLRTAIQEMQVKAPQDGIIIYKTGWRDEKKKVGDLTWVGDKLMELPDLSLMKGRGEVDEADAGHIAVGQKATIRLEAHPDVDFAGRVRSIGRTVRRQSWRVPTKIYAIDIALDKTDPIAMRPAMRFRGDIETARIRNLLVVTHDAVFLRKDGPVVWIKHGLRFEERSVRLGRSNKNLVEVLSGLSEGDMASTVDLRPSGPLTRAPMTAGL